MAVSPSPTTPNRVGLRSGQISELTVIVPLKTGDAGAAELRKILAAAGPGLPAAGEVGTLHDMRFVILDNDTKLLFATAYDGDWDSYIDDFAKEIPDAMDRFFSCVEGWPGIKDPGVKDFIVKYQIQATGWFVAYPNETVSRIKRAVAVRDAANVLLNFMSEGF
jgi:hypothetical protein